MNDQELPYAEDCAYWKTGRSDPSTILEQVVKMIQDHGGIVTQEMLGRVGNNAGVLVEFSVAGDSFRVAWPVLDSKYENPPQADFKAAKRQAVTFVKHDVKAKLMAAEVLGFKAAFTGNLITDSGQTVTEFMNQGIARIPKMITG